MVWNMWKGHRAGGGSQGGLWNKRGGKILVDWEESGDVIERMGAGKFDFGVTEHKRRTGMTDLKDR